MSRSEREAKIKALRSYADGTLPKVVQMTPKATSTGVRTVASQKLAQTRASRALEMIQSLDPDELEMALQEPDHAYRLIRERLRLGHGQASKVADAMIGAADDVARREIAINGMIDSLMRKASTSNLAKFGKKAAGAIGKAGTFGVDALLEPMFGAMQNDPEMNQYLRSMGVGVAPKEYKKGSLPSFPSRTLREAKIKAMYGDRYPAVLVSEMGGRKRDRREMLGKELGSYQGGTLGSRLQGFKSDLRSGDVFRMLTGMGPQDIRGAASRAAISTDPYLTNAPSHSAATEAIARRFGPSAANLVGVAQELPSGVANTEAGSDFVTGEGESGFSLPDLVANASGALRSRMIPDPLTMGILAGGMMSPRGSPTRELAQEAFRQKARALLGR